MSAIRNWTLKIKIFIIFYLNISCCAEKRMGCGMILTNVNVQQNMTVTIPYPPKKKEKIKKILYIFFSIWRVSAQQNFRELILRKNKCCSNAILLTEDIKQIDLRSKFVTLFYTKTESQIFVPSQTVHYDELTRNKYLRTHFSIAQGHKIGALSEDINQYIRGFVLIDQH